MRFPVHNNSACVAVALLLSHIVVVQSFAGISTGPFVTTSSSSSSSSALSMAKAGALPCRPIGIGSAAPTTVITNGDLESVVETSDDWIRTRTGIAQRHVLLQDQSLRALQIQAAQHALDMAEVEASALDLVVVATSSPDDMFGDAPSIANALGCTSDTVAYDLTAACSGFLFATVTAGQFLSHMSSSSTTATPSPSEEDDDDSETDTPAPVSRKALVIGADALSRFVDWDDRNSCILFGDGAGAMVLESTTEGGLSNGLLGYAAHSNGGGYRDLNLGYQGEARHVATPGKGTVLSSASYQKIGMNGREVYKFATREVPRVLQEAMQMADISVDEIDWLVLHQANIRIMEIVADRLGIPMEKVITNLSEYGNTSAASIPLALDAAVRSGKIKPGDVLGCAGFGAGLSWGAAILRWS